jgi:hypothetical protein
MKGTVKTNRTKEVGPVLEDILHRLTRIEAALRERE